MIVTLETYDFKEMVAAVIFAAAKDNQRKTLINVCFEIEGSTLILYASSRYILSKSMYMLDKNYKSARFLISSPDLKRLVKNIGKKNYSLEIDIPDNLSANDTVSFKWDDKTVAITPVSGFYPNASKVIPENLGIIFFYIDIAVKQVVDLIPVFKDDYKIGFTIQNFNVLIDDTKIFNRKVRSIPIQRSELGDDVSFCLYIDTFKQAFSGFPYKTVRIYIQDSVHMLVITKPESSLNKIFTCVIMPIEML